MLLEFPADQELDVIGDRAVFALGGLLELLLEIRGDADMDGISFFSHWLPFCPRDLRGGVKAVYFVRIPGLP